MATDNPPPQSSTVVTYSSMVRKADPDYDKDFSWAVEYRFGDNDRKLFWANPQLRGAYTPE